MDHAGGGMTFGNECKMVDSAADKNSTYAHKLIIVVAVEHLRPHTIITSQYANGMPHLRLLLI